MLHRFKITLLTALLAFSFTAKTAQGAVSYLLIQGEFDTGNAGLETYKWKVEYTSSILITGFGVEEQNTGLALLAAVFGDGSVSGSGVYGNATNQVNMPSGFLSSFTLGGTTVSNQNPYPTAPQWGYSNAGGSYDTSWPVASTGTYPAGTWTPALTGMNERLLADGSFDAWTHGVLVDTGTQDGDGYQIYTPHPVEGSGNYPTIGDFSGAETLVAQVNGYTVYSIAAAPEPGRGVLLLIAGMALVTRRRRSLS